MATRLLDRAAAPPDSLAEQTLPHTHPPTATPDAGYDALPRLTRLAADLAAVRGKAKPRWKEPPLFFFDKRRQAALELARPEKRTPDPLADLAYRVAAELPGLCESIEVRQVARAVSGLRAAAEAIAPIISPARDLADLLAMPEDETITVLHPALRTGFRIVVRGLADIGQFHILLADATDGVLPGPMVPARFVEAYCEANPTAPAGVPMVAEARFQLYAPAALRPDGTLPDGFGGSDHWLWPHAALATVPRIAGERVILLGPPAYRSAWEISRRFPALAAEVRLLEVLSPFRVAERLGQLTGTPLAPAPRTDPRPELAKAA
jgi:hypothetical protein